MGFDDLLEPGNKIHYLPSIGDDVELENSPKPVPEEHKETDHFFIK
jgi:hypothetical protein